MIVTKDFVVLNYPKSGSSFVRAVFKMIFEARINQNFLVNNQSGTSGVKDGFYEELTLPNIKIKSVIKSPDQHGCYSQIPLVHRNKLIISVARNPISRFASVFEFKGFQKWPAVEEKKILEKFPRWPDINIEEYLDYQNLQMIHGRLGGRVPKAYVGNQTIQFIQMFFKDPDKIINNISDEYIDSDDFLDDMGTVKFFRQESLKDDLMKFMAETGFSDFELDMVKSMGAVNVTKNRNLGLGAELPEKFVKEIMTLERLIFRIYRYHGIEYTSELVRTSDHV